jgi:hypothetical protein
LQILRLFFSIPVIFRLDLPPRARSVGAIVDQPEGATTFYEFAEATAEAVKHDRRHQDEGEK